MRRNAARDALQAFQRKLTPIMTPTIPNDPVLLVPGAIVAPSHDAHTMVMVPIQACGIVVGAKDSTGIVFKQFAEYCLSAQRKLGLKKMYKEHQPRGMGGRIHLHSTHALMAVLTGPLPTI